MMYSTISLFSGALGLDLGFHQTGRFGLLAAAEHDSACCSTICVNHAAGRLGAAPFELYEANVASLDPQRVMAELKLAPGQLDALIGGPPCTPFTTSGNRRGVADPVGLMAWHMLAFVRVFRPRVFVMENVLGLRACRLSTRSPEGSVLQELLSDIPTEYQVKVLTVNAAHYGVPQRRRRVFLIGNRIGGVPVLPPPTHGPGRLPYRTVTDALAGLDESQSTGVSYSPKRKAVLEMVPAGGNWRNLPKDVAVSAIGQAYFKGPGSNWFRRLDPDRPAPTITTHPASSMICRCHPSETRPLTIAESRRLMGFPDEWEFCGPIRAQYRQLGNAVPPGLGRVIGEMVAALLDGGNDHPDRHDPRPPTPPTGSPQQREVAGWDRRHNPTPPMVHRMPLPLAGGRPNRLDPHVPPPPRHDPNRGNPNHANPGCGTASMLAREKEEIGGFSWTSKMPGPSWGIPASRCLIGSELRDVEGSVCHHCYAMKGNYRHRNVQAVLERRYRLMVADMDRWVEAMIRWLTWRASRFVPTAVDRGFPFRWFDSGDLQSAMHLRAICKIAEATQAVRFADGTIGAVFHWLPTREYGFVEQVQRERGGFPANLCIRKSAHMVDGVPPHGYGLPVSTVHTHEGAHPGAHMCPARDTGGECGTCRACWNPAARHVSYPLH